MGKSVPAEGSVVSFDYVTADGEPRTVEGFKVDETNPSFITGVREDGAVRRYTLRNISNLR